MKIIENCLKDLLNPVIVNLSTALILFLAALTFRPVRQILFPPEEIKEYPLICTAEPHKSSSNKKLIVDFFIINRTGDEYSRRDLSAILKTFNPNPDMSPSPDIELKYRRRFGRVDTAYAEQRFNSSKGDLSVKVDHKSKAVTIVVNFIKPRAILKVSIVVSGLPALENSEIKRSSKSAIPFDLSEYERKCYKG